MLEWIYCQNYIVKINKKIKKHSQLGPKLSFKMTYSAFKLYIYHYGSSGNWTLDLDIAKVIQMSCSWATRKQKDIWQRLYNYLPFPEVLSFPCERCISMVINFKNKDQSVSMPMPKSKSITLTALTPPPRLVRQHFMNDVNSQHFLLSHCHTETLSGLQYGILAYMVFPIPVYIMSERHYKRVVYDRNYGCSHMQQSQAHI